MRHVPVLLHEVIDALDLSHNKHIIDGTLGDGGHSEAILEATGPSGRLLGIDTDPESLLRAKQYLHRFASQTIYARENFTELKRIVTETKFKPVDGILLDLGWSSPQFAERGRGFSFELDEPLDMRLSGASDSSRMTCAEILNTATESELYEVLYRYGEERFSEEIAAAIVAKRSVTPYVRTTELVETVLSVYRERLKSDKDVPWIGGLHPATRTFQAFRIAVNDELRVIERTIPDAIDILASRGRLAIITFHSLEDRIVKHMFKELSKTAGDVITKKPIIPTEEEIQRNTRSRSAKLRVFQKQ
jgi:16S rRNA (cytosine1402-N4)-methyltransferase